MILEVRIQVEWSRILIGLVLPPGSCVCWWVQQPRLAHCWPQPVNAFAGAATSSCLPDQAYSLAQLGKLLGTPTRPNPRPCSNLLQGVVTQLGQPTPRPGFHICQWQIFSFFSSISKENQGPQASTGQTPVYPVDINLVLLKNLKGWLPQVPTHCCMESSMSYLISSSVAIKVPSVPILVHHTRVKPYCSAD